MDDDRSIKRAARKRKRRPRWERLARFVCFTMLVVVALLWAQSHFFPRSLIRHYEYSAHGIFSRNGVLSFGRHTYSHFRGPENAKWFFFENSNEVDRSLENINLSGIIRSQTRVVASWV